MSGLAGLAAGLVGGYQIGTNMNRQKERDALDAQERNQRMQANQFALDDATRRRDDDTAVRNAGLQGGAIVRPTPMDDDGNANLPANAAQPFEPERAMMTAIRARADAARQRGRYDIADQEDARLAKTSSELVARRGGEALMLAQRGDPSRLADVFNYLIPNDDKVSDLRVEQGEDGKPMLRGVFSRGDQRVERAFTFDQVGQQIEQLANPQAMMATLAEERKYRQAVERRMSDPDYLLNERRVGAAERNAATAESRAESDRVRADAAARNAATASQRLEAQILGLSRSIYGAIDGGGAGGRGGRGREPKPVDPVKALEDIADVEKKIAEIEKLERESGQQPARSSAMRRELDTLRAGIAAPSDASQIRPGASMARAAFGPSTDRPVVFPRGTSPAAPPTRVAEAGGSGGSTAAPAPQARPGLEPRPDMRAIRDPRALPAGQGQGVMDLLPSLQPRGDAAGMLRDVRGARELNERLPRD